MRDPIGIVARHVAGAKIVAENRLHTQGPNSVDVDRDRFSTLSGVPLHHLGWNRCLIEKRIVEELSTSMREESFDMLRSGEAQAFIRLCHQVPDIHLQRMRFPKSFGNSMHQ